MSTLALQDDDGPLSRVAHDARAALVGAGPAADSAAVRSRTSRLALDWFVFFVADMQTGFGPFVAVYLTASAWTQADIGLILTVGGLIALVGQVPGGALLDWVHSPRWAAAAAIAGIGISALALALWPVFWLVLASRILHASASCLLGPAIAAISLRLAGHDGLGERIGRNARFASLGAGLSAAAMGATGYFLTDQSVFLVTAALTVPTLLALTRIRVGAAAGAPSGRSLVVGVRAPPPASLRRLVGNRALIVFAGGVVLFHLANAAMLPLMGGVMAAHTGQWAMVSIAACMIVPQLVVALCSPWVGRQANAWGRRPLLIAAFAALAVRGLMFALVTNPYLIVAVQLFDGISAAVLGVMFPLVVADLTRRTGHFNLTLGIVGSAMGVGASLSTLMAGFMVDHAGRGATFIALAGVAMAGLALVALLMPETRPHAGTDAATADPEGRQAVVAAG